MNDTRSLQIIATFSCELELNADTVCGNTWVTDM